MNIYKLLKPVLPAVMALSTSLFIAGCGSSSDDPAIVTPPPVPPPTAGGLASITGIWDGTFTWTTTGQTKVYDVTMLFHTPDGAEEGTAVGVALGNGPDDENLPHFLFEGGYEYFVDPVTSDPLNDKTTVACDGDVWAIGRFGQNGTFVQEFKYITGSAAGPDQRGSGCLYLRDTDDDGYVNELTGQIQFEEAGKFNVALTYSQDNTRDVVVEDLGVMGSDEGTTDVQYHLWSNDNSGNYMTYTATYISQLGYTLNYLTVKENRNDTIDCGGLIAVTQVADLNLFTLEAVNDAPISGCNLAEPNVYILPDGSPAKDVNLPYFGLGALYDLDGDGTLEFIHLVASKEVQGVTSQAQYNQFIVTQ